VFQESYKSAIRESPFVPERIRVLKLCFGEKRRVALPLFAPLRKTFFDVVFSWFLVVPLVC
jgi:hypothetical protein